MKQKKKVLIKESIIQVWNELKFEFEFGGVKLLKIRNEESFGFKAAH